MILIKDRFDVFLSYQKMASVDNIKNNRAFTREGRKQLFAVLQSARGSSGDSKLISASIYVGFICP